MDSPSSPTSRLQFPVSPEHDPPVNSSPEHTPIVNFSSPEQTPRVVDTPTPSIVASSAESPNLLPLPKRQRLSKAENKLPTRETIKRQLLQQYGPTDESSSSESSSSQYVDKTPDQPSERFLLPIEEAALPINPSSAQPVPIDCESGNESSGDSNACDDFEDMPSSAEECFLSDSHDSESDSSNVELNSQSAQDDGSSSEDISDDEEDLLYKGANHSVSEAVLKIMNLYMKHHWTQKCLADSLMTFKSMLPEPNELPPSVYQLFQYVEGFSSMPPAEKFFYCSNQECFKPRNNTDEKCSSCGGEEMSKFFYFSLEEQIKYLFEHRNLAQLMDSYKQSQNNNPDVISDITSGEEYAKVKSKLHGLYDIVLRWFTDGVSGSGSSGITFYPLVCELAEIIPELRSSFLLIVGVWCDTKKPPMNAFLKPFTTALIKIKESGGVSWTHSSGHKFKSLVVAPLLTADAPAKAEVLQVQYYSALYGCHTCEQKRAKVKPVIEAERPREKKQGRGKTGQRSKGDTRIMRRFVYQDNSADLRSGESMDQQGIKAERKKKPVKGVLGRAVVSDIPLFDRARCVTAEYLHSVLLGVVKYFLLLWLYTAGPWFIGNHVKEMDEFLKSIRVPDFVNQMPRGVKDAKNFWKASEFRSWLLYYSLPALFGILPDKFFQHWVLLVEAIYILLQDSITSVELDRASLLLKTFVRDVNQLYGAKYYTYNVHQLLHLCLLNDGALFGRRRHSPLRPTMQF